MRSPYSDVLGNKFYFSASTAQGATGEIVATDVFLTVAEWPGRFMSLQLAACYDPTKLEAVGDPVFSEEYDSMVYWGMALWLPGNTPRRHLRDESGFLLTANVLPDVSRDLLQGGNPVHLVTLFFRILGQPGDIAEVRFCDGEWVERTQSCIDNSLQVPSPPGAEAGSLLLRSVLHESGLIRILPGEPKHTEVPDTPPAAKIYPEEPTPETAQLLFELSGGVVRPGARSVPLKVHVTSNYEFCGFMLALRFPPHLVQVASVEERVRPGAVWIDNETGWVGVFLADSFRRIGQEMESVHVATLRVDISPDPTDEEIPFRFERAGHYLNWLAIRYGTGGVGGAIVPVLAQVAPLRVSAAALRLQARPTTLGDVNLDYKLDISDAVGLLGYLFLGGEEPVCEAASDANADGRLNLADAVAILNALFRGHGELIDTAIWCNGEH